MAKNTRNYPKRSEEELNITIKKLRSRLRKLQKENKILKEENNTLRQARNETDKFLKDNLKDVPLEDLLTEEPSERQKILDYWKKYAQDLKENKDE